MLSDVEEGSNLMYQTDPSGNIDWY